MQTKIQKRSPVIQSANQYFITTQDHKRWTSKTTACSGIPMAETPQNKMHTMEKNADQV